MGLLLAQQLAVDPDHRPALARRQVVFRDVPPVPRPVLATRIAPVPYLLPLRLVILNPLAELTVLQPAAGQHRDESATPRVDVLHRLRTAEFAVGHVQERR